MYNVKVTVGNAYTPVVEEFLTRVDMSDIAEVDACVTECCGQYLDMHSPIWDALNVDFGAIADACWYMVEGVTEI